MKNKLFSLFSLVTFLMATNVFAAIQVTTVPSPTTAIINQPVSVSVIITNTGASALSISQLIPTGVYAIATSGGQLQPGLTPNQTGSVVATSPTISWAHSVFNIGPGAPNLSVPALTTVTVAYAANFFAPSTGSTGSGTGAYLPGAVVYLSDGSVNPTTATGAVIINPIPLPTVAEPVP